ncbi:hypothetical protein RDWZM_002969 [Blomia tropicalis]|uniref:Uncharacterized protein n=1 Tax=Blomia tropicalis TaxID=40697 RepID=A0A9Q0RS27_BLOTA|nr:hypothetical protein RDWZM_002969 [Blomia tropicalis]
MESLPMEVENCSHPSHLIQECDFMNSNEETNPFFQNIDDQISSVDFTNDFQDILDEHFPKNNDNNNLERRKSSFSRFNFDFSEEIEQCSNDVQSITSEIIDVDKQSTTVDVYDEPIKEIKLPNSKQNRKGIQMKRKRRGWRHRFPKNKTNKIPILKRFLGMWCSSKKGYSYLKQQLNDSQLTEFSQPFISPQLKKYFSHKKLVSSPIVKQSLPQSLSSNKSSSIGCEQLSLHSCEKQLDNNDQLEFCTTSDFLNEVRQDRNRVSYIDCNQLVTQMLDDIIHRTQDLSLVDFIHNNSSNRSNLKSFAAQTFSHLLNEPRIVLHQTNTILNNSLKHNDIIIKLA